MDHPFTKSHKYKEIEESVIKLVHAMYAPPDQCSLGCIEINEKDNQFWIMFHFAFANETQLNVRCDFEYIGKCSKLNQISFI